MPFTIVRDDITHLHVDAIVNAANERLWEGGGVCGAIFAAAGSDQLRAACSEIGFCPTGSAVATPAFNLPARHIIHAVGPIWHGGTQGERELLGSCYRNALETAYALGDRSIAFPLISSGIYGYPKRDALAVARDEIRAFLETHEMDVTLVLFDRAALDAGSTLNERVARYIDDTYVEASGYTARSSWERNLPASQGGLRGQADSVHARTSTPAPAAPMAAPAEAKRPSLRERLFHHRKEEQPAGDALSDASAYPTAPSIAQPRQTLSLDEMLDHLDSSFSETLLTLIDRRGLTDAQAYKRANVSRQHFSKIRSNPAYQPKKVTVLAFAVALELSLDETRMLLERAGFALSHADKRDIIVEFFISQHIYDVFLINQTLFDFDQQLLG